MPFIFDKLFPKHLLHAFLFERNNMKISQHKENGRKTNAIKDPSRMPKPMSQINMLRYIGLRLRWNGPDVTKLDDSPRSWKLVPALRNSMAAQVINPRPRSITNTPKYEYGLGIKMMIGVR
jgi:hypothetical protein